MLPRCLVSLALLAVWQPPDQASGCHFTDITIRNGTWCCGAGSGLNLDTGGKNVTPPPLIPPTPPPQPSSPEPKITTTTTTTTTTVTDTTTTAPPRPPVGDCPCGNMIKDPHQAANEGNDLERVLSQNPDALKTIHRPWLVKIIVRKDSGVEVECSGSLLNKRYIITAAHCLCGTVVKCNPELQSSNKVFSAEREPSLKRIVLVMGGGDKKNGFSQDGAVSKVIVHPDFYQYSGETVIGQTDVALIKTASDLFGLNEDGTGTNDPKVEPICLPPKTGFMLDKNSTGVNEPFEDLDCKLIHENIREVPYPYKLSTLEDSEGWLSCHPGGFAHGADISIEGRNSFITAYGSTAREDLDEKVRYQCSTNSYGPEDSILRRCDSKCHKTLREKVEVDLGEYGRTQIVKGNPSLAEDLCATFRVEKLQEAMAENARQMSGDKLDSQGYSLDEKFNFLGWIRILNDNNKDIICYPHLHSEGLDTAREMWDLPYKHGWCEVCQGPNMTGTDCTPSPGSGWGWCQDPIDDEIREAAVDAFVFENCSRNVNLYTEFCTAAPITSGFGQIWRYFEGNGTWLKIRNEHTTNIGDVCYGDAGGSVWKYWMFRAPDAAEDKRVHKLAVLTGVVSRFEEHCGDVYSRLPSIHTRVSGVLDWINSVIGDGRCGARDDQMGDNDDARNDTGAAEQRVYPNHIDSSEFYEFEEDNEIGSEEETEGRVQGPITAEDSDLDQPEVEVEPFNAPYINWT